jgi:hypothetical protein
VEKYLEPRLTGPVKHGVLFKVNCFAKTRPQKCAAGFWFVAPHQVNLFSLRPYLSGADHLLHLQAAVGGASGLGCAPYAPGPPVLVQNILRTSFDRTGRTWCFGSKLIASAKSRPQKCVAGFLGRFVLAADALLAEGMARKVIQWRQAQGHLKIVKFIPTQPATLKAMPEQDRIHLVANS